MEIIYTVTIRGLYPNDDMDPWTSAFSSREKAEAFIEKVCEKFEEHGDDGNYTISVDSGVLDSEAYLDWIDDFYEEG